MSGDWSVAQVVALLMVLYVVAQVVLMVLEVFAPAVGGVAVWVEVAGFPGMRRAAGVQKEDDDVSCTGLITERLHAVGLGFKTVNPVLLVVFIVYK